MSDGPFIDRAAEESVIGSMLLSIDAIESAGMLIDRSDFGIPAHAAVFDAILALYGNGMPVDPVTVTGQLDGTGFVAPQDGDTKRLLIQLQGATPASANAAAYARTVAGHADRRRLQVVGAELSHDASDPMTDVETLRDRARTNLDALARPDLAATHTNFADWAPGVSMGYDWIIPDVLEAGDRLLLVAGEGSGKSVILRQWAIMAAAGIHWFDESRIPSQRTLIIDVENSSRQIVRGTSRMYDYAKTRSDFDDDNFVVIPVGASLDLTARADRMRVEQYLAGHRPNLLVIGPLYKLMRMVRQGSTYEEQAADLTQVLDGWRERYGCAILIEHHAAKGSGGQRNLDPIGSSLFLRWPEFVLTLEHPEDKSGLWKLGHARGQREPRSWPSGIRRGGRGWMWSTVDDSGGGTF